MTIITLTKMKPEDRESYWQTMIAEWRASGLSQKKFAKEKGVKCQLTLLPAKLIVI